MREAALWFCLSGLSWALFVFVVEPWLRGRITTFEYHDYLRSPEWAAVTARLAATRRGQRCAACSARTDLHVHHWSYRCLGYESLWQLVRLCGRHHKAVHTTSEWVFSSKTRGLWLATPLTIAAVRLSRLGRRTPDRVIPN
jgi:hypothetical protein